MKTGTKYTLLLVIVFILGWLWKSLSIKKEKVDEIIIDGIHTPRKPCISVINEIYGLGIDSNKACDCLIPKFYELIKNDSFHLAKFKEVGLHELKGEENQKMISLFENCLRSSMLDSNYKLNLKGAYLKKFKDKLAEQLPLLKTSDNYNKDSIANCIMDKMNDNITLGEYLASDYLKVGKIRRLITECLNQLKK